MALYQITRSCGHIEEIQIYGANSHGERERRAEREERQPCRACVQALRDERNAEAGRVAAESGLPTLVDGSAKQIAWAESIRLAALADVEARAARIARIWADGPDARARAADAIGVMLTRALTGHTSARWWIDHRHPVEDAWAELGDDDRAAARAAADAQDLDDESDDSAPATPQAAVATLRAEGWSVRKLAAECGVHVSTVYRWARGVRVPNVRNAATLAALTRSM